jgi:metallo-beta-lactamase class B
MNRSARASIVSLVLATGWPLATLLDPAPSAAKPLSPDPPHHCDSCAEWNAPQEPFRIHGTTYYVGPGGLSSLVVKTDSGLALFDGGLPQSAPEIAAHLEKLGLRLTDVKLIFNSHAHYDHAGGIAALQRASGATVVASPRGAEALERGGPTSDDPQFGIGEAETAFPKVARVRRVADGEVVKLGDLAVTTHWTPGHTPGSTSWTWKSCEGGRCLTVVYADSLTPVSADDFRFSADGGARVEEFSRSIDKVAQLPCDILVVPHPSVVDLFGKLARRAAKAGAPDPLIDPTACATYATGARERLKKRLESEVEGRAAPQQ